MKPPSLLSLAVNRFARGRKPLRCIQRTVQSKDFDFPLCFLCSLASFQIETIRFCVSSFLSLTRQISHPALTSARHFRWSRKRERRGEVWGRRFSQNKSYPQRKGATCRCFHSTVWRAFTAIHIKSHPAIFMKILLLFCVYICLDKLWYSFSFILYKYFVPSSWKHDVQSAFGVNWSRTEYNVSIWLLRYLPPQCIYLKSIFFWRFSQFEG